MMRALFVIVCAGALLAGSALAATHVVVPAAKPESAAPVDAAVAPTTAPPKPTGPLELIMRGLDKISGRSTTLVAPIGKPIHYATLTITAHYCYSTPPTETPETAAFVQIDDHRPDQPGRRVFSGWMYASSPGLHGMEHPLYDVWVMTCKASAPGQAVAVGPLKPVKPVSPDSTDNEKPTALPDDAGQ
jgi:hypothetical protein